MPFQKCPECGATNYAENSFSLRTFDCGFQGQLDKRDKRCDHPKGRAPEIPAEVARYRLALLDAAQAAETIANDMAQSGAAPDFAERCYELARQMRAFAGHSVDYGGNVAGRNNFRNLLSVLRIPKRR